MSALSPAPRPVPTPLTKPLLRRPPLVRKRDDVEDDSPPSPEKRSKVSFNSNVEVRVLGDWEKAPQLIQEEVRHALEQHALGDNSGYLRVKDVFSVKSKTEDESSNSMLRSYTSALLGNVSSLNRSCSDLVYCVLQTPWLAREDDDVNLYIRFLANLVSAQGVFLADVVRMLTENLTTGRSYRET